MLRAAPGLPSRQMGAEMSGDEPRELKWEKIRLTEEMRSRLDRAATEVTPISGGGFRIIRHPFGKVLACRSANLLFFDVSDGGRPPELLPLAITMDAEPKVLVPTRRTEDFNECCDLLGLRDEEQRDQFRSFLLPRSELRGGRRRPATGSGNAVRAQRYRSSVRRAGTGTSLDDPAGRAI